LVPRRHRHNGTFSYFAVSEIIHLNMSAMDMYIIGRRGSPLWRAPRMCVIDRRSVIVCSPSSPFNQNTPLPSQQLLLDSPESAQSRSFKNRAETMALFSRSHSAKSTSRMRTAVVILMPEMSSSETTVPVFPEEVSSTIFGKAPRSHPPLGIQNCRRGRPFEPLLSDC
jgi:hypothetical protein